MQKKKDTITDIIIPRNPSLFLSLLLISGFFLIALRYGGVLRQDQILISGIIFFIFFLSLPFIPLSLFKDKFLFLFVLFLIFSTISLLKTPDKRGGLLDVILIFDFIFLYVITKYLSSEREIRRLLNTGIAVSASLLVILNLLKPVPIKGNFANPSHFSAFLSSTLPLLLLSRSTRKSGVPWILSFILLTGILLTGAWGGILSLFVSFLIYIFINRSKLFEKRWVSYFSFFFFLLFISIFSVYKGIERSFSLNGLISSISSRLDMWKYGIRCGLRFLRFGSGIGSF